MKYLLVMFPLGKAKISIFAMKSMIKEDKAKVILQDANATIFSPEHGNWIVVEKRFYVVLDTLHIIVDVKPKKA